MKIKYIETITIFAVSLLLCNKTERFRKIFCVRHLRKKNIKTVFFLYLKSMYYRESFSWFAYLSERVKNQMEKLIIKIFYLTSLGHFEGHYAVKA